MMNNSDSEPHSASKRQAHSDADQEEAAERQENDKSVENGLNGQQRGQEEQKRRALMIRVTSLRTTPSRHDITPLVQNQRGTAVKQFNLHQRMDSMQLPDEQIDEEDAEQNQPAMTKESSIVELPQKHTTTESSMVQSLPQVEIVQQQSGPLGLEEIKEAAVKQLMKSQKSMDANSSSKKRESLYTGSGGVRQDDFGGTGRQSARSADDEVDKGFDKQARVDRDTPEKIRNLNLDKFRDVSPGGSLIKSARSLHTKENLRDKSVVTSKNNADLMNDLGVKNQKQLTRNKQIQRIRQHLTSNQEEKQLNTQQEGGGIIVSDRVELIDQQSINLTEFKSYNATSEQSKNVFSAQYKDGGVHAPVEATTLQEYSNKVVTSAFAKQNNQLKPNEAAIQLTVNTDLAEIQSSQQQQLTQLNQQQPQNVGGHHVTTTSSLPQINLGISDQFERHRRCSQQNPHIKSPKPSKLTKKGANPKQQQITSRQSHSPRHNRNSKQYQTSQPQLTAGMKPFVFGKVKPEKSSAVGFASNLLNNKPQTPKKRSQFAGAEQLIADSQNKRRMLNSTHKTSNVHSLTIAGNARSCSKQLFKQQAGQTAGNNFTTNNELLMPEVNGRGLIGKNQATVTSTSIYSGFRPAKIKKSKRNALLTTTSYSPARPREGLDALSNKQDAAIVNMTPLNQIPQNLVNQAAPELPTYEEHQAVGQGLGGAKYSYPDQDLSSEQSSTMQKAYRDNGSQFEEKVPRSQAKRRSSKMGKESGLKVYQKVADTQVNLPPAAEEQQQLPTGGKKYTLNVQTPQTDLNPLKFNHQNKQDITADKTLNKTAETDLQLMTQGVIDKSKLQSQKFPSQEQLLANNIASRGAQQNDCIQEQVGSEMTQPISQTDHYTHFQKVDSYRRQTSKQTLLMKDQDGGEQIVNIDPTAMINQANQNNPNQRNTQQVDSEMLQAAMAIQSRTEESKQSLEAPATSQILFSDHKAQMARNNQQSRQHLMTSKTNFRSSSGNEKQHGSNIESSIANIQCIQASNDKHTNDPSQKMLYAEKVLVTQSSEPLSVGLINNAHPQNQVMTMPILNTEGEEKHGVLAQVLELGESSTGNLGTLQRDGATESNYHAKHRSVDAGFGQLVKSRLEQKEQLQEAGQNEGHQTLPQRDGKVLIINEDNTESINDPGAPQMVEQPTHQQTERLLPGNKMLALGEQDSSVTGTHQQAQYLMSNRYSNRGSVQYAKDSGNQSYSFGATTGGENNKAAAQKTSNQQTANQSAAQKPSPSTAKMQSPVPQTKQAKDGSKNAKKSMEQSTVSPFKTSKKSKLSSISQSQHLATSKDMSPINSFKDNVNQAENKGAAEDMIDSSTSQEVEGKHQAVTSPNQMYDTSIEVEDQQQLQSKNTEVITSKTGGGGPASSIKMKNQVSWQQPQPTLSNNASLKEYGYLVHGVQQFDQMPPPSSGYFSHSRVPEQERSNLPTRDNPDSISSPKLTDFSKPSPNKQAEDVDVQNQQATKFAELISINDPMVLEQRLKSLLQSKNMFFTADKATPGIDITNEENKDQDQNTSSLQQSEENLTNLQTRTPFGAGAALNSLQQNQQPLKNVFDHNRSQASADNYGSGGAPPGSQSQQQSTIQTYHGQTVTSTSKDGVGGGLSYLPSENQQRHNLFNVPPMPQAANMARKPMTAGGAPMFKKSSTLLQGMTNSGRQRKKMTVLEKYPAGMMAPITKPSSYFSGGKMSHQMAKTMMPFAGGLTHSSSEKNFVANTVGVLQKQIQSGEIQATQSMPALDPKFDIIGKNPLRKFKTEIVQINLLKQMKIILDPSAKSVDLYKAGFNFIKLLFGDNYKPNETEVSEIVHFICSNPSIPLENLIRVSNTVSNQQKQQLDQKMAEKSQHSRRSGQVKKVGFGRAISEPGTSKAAGRFCSTGYLTLGDKTAKQQQNDMRSNGGQGENLENEDQKAQAKQSMKLNAISRKMIDDYKKKKDKLKNYQTKVLTRQIDDLRKKMGPEIFSDQLKRKIGTRSVEPACMTPQRSTNKNELSQCSTFDNVTPIRVDQATGAATYITQMAQVDMEMKKRNQSEDELLGGGPHIRSTSELKQRSQADQLDQNNQSNQQPKRAAKKRQTPPPPASMATAGKLSMLLIAQDNGLKTYIEAKKRMSMASQLNALSAKKNQKMHIMNRMVPSEKTQLTEMLHQYIQAHKLKSASEVRKIGGSQGAFSLVTGQSEAIKEEYSAVTMHPKEKVNQLLKYRDELRKLARDSNRIASSKAQMQILNNVVDGPIPNTANNLDSHFALFNNQDDGVHEANNIYEQRRVKVMSQFKTIEKIKQMETGSRNVMPGKKVKKHVQSHKQLPALRISNKGEQLEGTGKEDFTNFVQSSELASATAENFASGLGQLEGAEGAKSFAVMPAKNMDNIDLDVDEDLKAAKQHQDEAMTKHFENIENNVNQEPAMIYKKNNLLLEKIILDRALNKVQKRRFIKSNMPR